MDITESQYKFNLALDMIYYLTQLLLYNHPNKTEMVEQLVSKWDARVHKNLNKIRYNEAMAFAEREEVGTDVASILVSTQQVEIYILKREFKEYIQQLLIRNLCQEETKKK